MINLLREHDKKILIREYQLRVIVVALAFLTVCTLFGFILLIPSYLLSYYDQKYSKQQIASANQTALSEHKDLMAHVASLKQKIGVLNQDSKAVMPLDVISTIIKDKGTQNKIKGISFNTVDGTVSLKGTSATRQSLVEFTTALKAEPMVASVDLPISSLAQDSNVSFDIKITLKK